MYSVCVHVCAYAFARRRRRAAGFERGLDAAEIAFAVPAALTVRVLARFQKVRRQTPCAQHTGVSANLKSRNNREWVCMHACMHI